MAFKKGTANNFADLLTQFLQFVTTDPALVAANQQYEVLFDTTIGFTGQTNFRPDRRHVVLRSRGLSGADQIYSTISTMSDTSADFFNWAINAGTAFIPDNLVPGYGDLRGGLAGPSMNLYTQFWNQPMTYWFFANGRRWFVVAKVSTNYSAGGAGFILPPCPPSEYRYPMAVWGGTTIPGVRWSDVSFSHAGMTVGSTQLRDPGGNWRHFAGSNDGAIESEQYSSKLPMGCARIGTFVNAQAALDVLNSIRDNPDGSFSLWPITFVRFTEVTRDNVPSGSTFGEADGLFWVPALNNGAEDEITLNGVKHIVFPSINRSGNPNLFALRAS